LMIGTALQVLGDSGTDPELLLEGDGPHMLAWRDWSDPADLVTSPGGFEACGVLDAREQLKSPAAPLPGGGSLVVEPTRALVAVDVNT
ncbi:ribonuclease G, partial [Enterococcus hirae]